MTYWRAARDESLFLPTHSLKAENATAARVRKVSNGRSQGGIKVKRRSAPRVPARGLALELVYKYSGAYTIITCIWILEKWKILPDIPTILLWGSCDEKLHFFVDWIKYNNNLIGPNSLYLTRSFKFIAFFQQALSRSINEVATIFFSIVTALEKFCKNRLTISHTNLMETVVFLFVS